MRSILMLTLCLFSAQLIHADHHESPFSSKTIDLGVVVSDLEKSVKFYTEAIGFKASGGFKVPGDFAAKAGLTDQSLDIKVLTLGDGAGATKLKLMQVSGPKGAKPKNEQINSTLGYSYITVMIKSTDDAMARLKKAGVKPIAKGPVALPKNLNPAIALTVGMSCHHRAIGFASIHITNATIQPR